MTPAEKLAALKAAAADRAEITMTVYDPAPEGGGAKKAETVHVGHFQQSNRADKR
jgi:hypothetical protein